MLVLELCLERFESKELSLELLYHALPVVIQQLVLGTVAFELRLDGVHVLLMLLLQLPHVRMRVLQLSSQHLLVTVRRVTRKRIGFESCDSFLQLLHHAILLAHNLFMPHALAVEQGAELLEVSDGRQKLLLCLVSTRLLHARLCTRVAQLVLARLALAPQCCTLLLQRTTLLGHVSSHIFQATFSLVLMLKLLPAVLRALEMQLLLHFVEVISCCTNLPLRCLVDFAGQVQ